MELRAIGEPEGGIMHELLAEMKERITGIADALTQLEQRDHAQTGLYNLQAHLLELIERDAGITAAADDLLSTATAFIEGDHPARGRLLGEAFHRFRDRLPSAHLSEHGRMLGLE